MLRRNHILTAAALLAMCVAPAYADAKTDLSYLPSTPAAGDGYQDLRSPDARDAGQVAETQAAQDLRSPDARDAGREPVPVPEPIVEIREAPSGGFDWGDAGIGAAGILAMVSIAAGLMLMVAGRRRRRASELPAH